MDRDHLFGRYDLRNTQDQMKKIVLLLFALTCMFNRLQAQDFNRLYAVSVPIESSLDYTTGKPVGNNLELSLSIAEMEGEKALIFLIFDSITKQTYARYVTSAAKAIIDNTLTLKDQLTCKSSLTLGLPKDSQSNAIFIFKEYFQGKKLVGMRVAEFDALTNTETKMYFIAPSLDFFPDSPQGDPYYPLLMLLLKAQDEGIIDQIKDITGK